MSKNRLAVIIVVCTIAIIAAILIPRLIDGTDTNSDFENTPTNAISWDEAKDHIGERTIVCGPVVDATWASGSNGKPTFLNLGKPYPDPDRFTVVIWIQNRSNFPQAPEDYYLGKTIYVTGLITEYEGVAQIEVTSPDQIHE